MLANRTRPTIRGPLAVREHAAHTSGCHAVRPGFTLIELLVVILIILLVSAVTLPTIIPALSHRQVSEAARIFQGALVGARDVAIRDNTPSGIRLIPDAVFNGVNPSNSSSGLGVAFPLAYSRIVPIGSAPLYSEGYAALYNASSLNFTTTSANELAFWQYNPGTLTWTDNNNKTNYPVPGLVNGFSAAVNNSTALVVVQADVDPNNGGPASPTSWFWNIRVGDQIQFSNSGIWYTVIGPMAIPPSGIATSGTNAPSITNPDMFVNVGPPGQQSPLASALPTPFYPYPEFLILVNGQDDNGNGWIDEGWDGVDNDGDGIVDDLANEWFDNELFLGAIGSEIPGTGSSKGIKYTIRRRPAPLPGAREISLPADVVIDATTWGNTFPERTRVPPGVFNAFSGTIELLINPDGSVVPTTIYSSPASFGLNGAFCHFWLAERSDVYTPQAPGSGQSVPPALPLPPGITPPATAPSNNGATIKGEYRLVTLFTRTGQITTNDTVPFTSIVNGVSQYNVNAPYVEAQRGVSGAQR